MNQERSEQIGGVGERRRTVGGVGCLPSAGSSRGVVTIAGVVCAGLFLGGVSAEVMGWDALRFASRLTVRDQGGMNIQQEGTAGGEADEQPVGNTAFDSNGLTDDEQADFELWKSGLTESKNPVARRTAATKMLESGWQIAIEFLGGALRESADSEVVLSIADAIAERSSPPSDLLGPLLIAFRRTGSTSRETIGLSITSYSSKTAIPGLVGAIRDESNPVGERVALIGLLSRFVEVETIDALIPCLDEKNQPEEVRSAASQALESITGVERIGQSELRWRDWWDRHRSAGREGLLAANLARLQGEIKELRRRDREFSEERAGLVNTSIHWIEQAYALTPQADRGTLLVALLEDKRAEIRGAGLRLIEQAMSNGQAVTAEVADAVASRVDDPEGSIRAEAIRRMTFIDGKRASSLAAARLPIEEDHDVRLALFSTLARYPSDETATALVTKFVDSPGRGAMEEEERRALTAALVAACRDGTLSDVDQRNRVAKVILDAMDEPTDIAKAVSQLGPDEGELLAWSPTDAARAVCQLVFNGSIDPNSPGVVKRWREIRLSVARGLAASGLDDELVLAAASDPEIHPIAFGLLMSRSRRLGALKAVLGDFGMPNDQVRLGDIGLIMAALPIENWIAADDVLADSRVVDLERRASWLRRVLNHSAEPESGGEKKTAGGAEGTDVQGPSKRAKRNDHGDAGGAPLESASDGMIRRAVCLRLTELELLLGRPGDALTALAAAPAAETDRDRERRLRTVAMIATEQVEEIAERTANLKDARVWLEALKTVDRMEAGDPSQESARQALKQKIAGKVRELGDATLSEEDRSRITAVLGEGDGGKSPPPSASAGGDDGG